jgi:trimeric autotransporter adhesin
MKAPSRQGLFASIFASAFLLLSARASFAQTDSLVLSSGTAAANGTVALSLVLSSPTGNEPSSLQWTLAYPLASVVSISATAGPALSTVGKSLTCVPIANTYICIASGTNAGKIANGTVATVNLTLATGASTTSIALGNTFASAADGTNLAISATGGTVIGGALPTVNSLVCNPTTLSSSSSSTCTVSLSGSAPAGGATVTLSDNSAALTVPTSVTVAASATSASFNATTSAIASDQSAIVTATYNSSSANAVVSLVAPVLVTSLTCNPTSLGSNASSTCTVGLSKVAPAGGANVTLSNTNAVLSAPASVTVPANATSAAFVTSTTNVSSNQSATLTAALGSSSVSATVSLTAAVSVVAPSSMVCIPSSLPAGASSTCTITLNKLTVGWSVIALSSDNANLTIPSAALIKTGTTGVFIATAASSIVISQNATLTATLNGNTTTAIISMTGNSVGISSLACNPASIGQNASATCTMNLSNVAPAGGATVTLSNSNPNLTAPLSVPVTVGATKASFAVTTSGIASDQSATLTATLGATSAATTVSLVAPILVSSLACTPSTLGPNASSTCTVTLTKAAPTGGAAVTLSDNSAALTVQSSVTVPAAATSATFNATTAAISSDQTATITASYNGSSANSTISLSAAVLVSSLACTPSTLGPNASSTCTVTLTKAAPTGGAAVTLSDNSAALTVQSSVTVPAAATSATFNATTAAITSDQTATITASYNGSSANSTINLSAAVLVSSLACTPSTLGPNASSTCTVTLTKAAPTGGANILIGTVGGVLTAPSSVVITAGSSTVSFTLQAGSFSANQSGSVTASYNGSTQSATVALATATTVTSLSCNPGGAMSGAVIPCTAILSRSVSVSTAVTLSSSNALITVPTSIVIAAASSSTTFNAMVGSVTADATGSVTARLGTSSQTANLTLWSTPVLSSFTCPITKLTGGSSATCTVTMSKSAGNVIVGLSSNNTNLTAPATVTIPQGSTSANFTVATASTASGWIIVSATFNGTSQAVLFTLTASTASSTSASLKQISCRPRILTFGTAGICRITLDHVDASTAADVQLTSSSSALLMPERVITRRGLSTVEFQVDAVGSGESIEVAATLGTGVVKETLTIAPDRSKPLRVPGQQFVKYGTEVRFQVLPADPAATISTGELPAGAYFAPATREFRWTPDGTQLGAHDISFTAVDSEGSRATASVTVQVDSGEPVLTGLINAASRSRELVCSPGAIATITGRWLTTGAVSSDPSGSSSELSGTKVFVNGVTTPILSASATELNLLCPDFVTGSELQFVLQTDHGTAGPLKTTVRSAAPGIFSLDGLGSGQAWASVENSGAWATVRNRTHPGTPATTGDRMLFYATGIDRLTDISVQIGDSLLKPVSVTAVAGHAGMHQVVLNVPDVLSNEDVSLLLSGTNPEGVYLSSNVLSVALEGNLR